MAIQYCCDFCGEAIDDGRIVQLDIGGQTVDGYLSPLSAGLLGHYHGDERRCWEEVIDRIGLIHAVSSGLGPDRADRYRAEREREREHRERMREWQRQPGEIRDELLMQALGSERLTVKQWTARLNAQLGSPSPEERSPTVYPSTVVQMAKRLLRDGVLEREPEPFQGKVRYRYFRKQALEGPIVDLERAYRDDDEAAA